MKVMNDRSAKDRSDRCVNRREMLLGVILCGGESRRMGRDKGLIQNARRPWALLMGDKLIDHQLPVVYSINQRQTDTYAAHIPPDQLIVDAAEWAGPLNGLISVHRRFPANDLLLLACDMPDLDAATISGLIDTYAAERADFFLYEEAGVLQPFCGIYTGDALAGAADRQQDGSLQRLFRGGLVRRLPVTEPRAFRNYNTL
jgi:molybdopterin-guanine dinucleotide biosynthesis protein A